METGNNSGTQRRTTVIRKSFSIIDESLRSGEDRSCHLVVETGPASVSYALLDKRKKKYLALESFSADEGRQDELLEAAAAQCENLRRPFASAAVIVSGPFTLVPAPFYDAVQRDLYLKYQHLTGEDDVIAADEMRACDARCVYATGRELTDAAARLFPGNLTVHACSVLAESLVMRYKHSEEQLAFVHVRDGMFDMLIVQGGKLGFCNTFRYATDEDFIYYILFVLEQLGANPDAVSVSLCGAVNKTDGKYRLLLKYVRNVHFTGRPSDMEYSYGFHELPEHQFFTLLSQYLCAS